MSSSRTPVQEDVNVLISTSLFSRVVETGTPEEKLVDYLCILENDQNSVKTRWLMIACAFKSKEREWTGPVRRIVGILS
jgi:hypothetical protein